MNNSQIENTKNYSIPISNTKKEVNITAQNKIDFRLFNPATSPPVNLFMNKLKTRCLVYTK